MAGFKIAQAKDASGKAAPETVIGYDRVKHQLYVDKGSGSKKQTIDLPGIGDKLRLRVLFDKSSLEVFVNDGDQLLTAYIYSGEGAAGGWVVAVGGTAVGRSLEM